MRSWAAGPFFFLGALESAWTGGFWTAAEGILAAGKVVCWGFAQRWYLSRCLWVSRRETKAVGSCEMTQDGAASAIACVFSVRMIQDRTEVFVLGDDRGCCVW